MAEASESFLKSVLRSGLLDREQLLSSLRAMPRDHVKDPRAIADHLFNAGQLSRFQAAKLLQGATLGLKLGPYRIETPIGRGGMGSVYLALDTRSDQHVAVKVLPPKKAKEEERRLTRFQREMALSQKLSHPHVAQTHEAGVSSGVYYIAMEYIPGLSLYRLVMTRGTLEVPLAAHLFAEVAAGLEHAHGLGLIHRDLKPSNIMVTPNDHAKVLDLGLAMMEGEVAEDVEVIGGKGYVVGSIDYMAPEQTHDATQVDARSDLYGLGCCLYFALSGRPPFPGGKVKDKVNAHRHQAPEPIQQRNPAVPEGFASLVHKLMAKKPEDRYPSAAALQADLLAWAPREEVRPVETEGDQAQQAAIAALAAGPLSSESLKDDMIKVEPPSADTFTSEPILPPDFFQEEREKSEIVALVMGIAAFWILVILVLLIVVMFR